jgi:hypothetical protein
VGSGRLTGHDLVRASAEPYQWRICQVVGALTTVACREAGSIMAGPIKGRRRG